MRDGAIHYKLYLLKLTMAVDNIVFRIIKGAFLIMCKMLVVTQLKKAPLSSYDELLIMKLCMYVVCICWMERYIINYTS